MNAKTIGAIAIAVLAAVVVIQNLAMATVTILFIRISMPVAILCAVMFILGAMTALLVRRNRP